MTYRCFWDVDLHIIFAFFEHIALRFWVRCIKCTGNLEQLIMVVGCSIIRDSDQTFAFYPPASIWGLFLNFSREDDKGFDNNIDFLYTFSLPIWIDSLCRKKPSKCIPILIWRAVRYHCFVELCAAAPSPSPPLPRLSATTASGRVPRRLPWPPTPQLTFSSDERG